MADTHQEMLQTCLVASGHVETCCLVRTKNGTAAASSYGYEPSPDLLHSLMAAFANTSVVRESGLSFNGASYSCVRADDNSIYGKKVGGSGFVAVKTEHFIVFGSYSSSMYPSVCVEAIESLGDYYRRKGR